MQLVVYLFCLSFELENRYFEEQCFVVRIQSSRVYISKLMIDKCPTVVSKKKCPIAKIKAMFSPRKSLGFGTVAHFVVT